MKTKELRNYAKLIVRVGANVQKGQDVVINANVSDEYFVKYVVEEAYKAKARLVSVEWMSDEIDKRTYKYAKTDVLKQMPEWKIKKLEYRRDTLPALIYIESSDPDALKDVDQNKIMEVRRAIGPIIKPIRKQMENKYQWTICSIPGMAWAQKVFPNDSKKVAFKKLWDAIIETTRINGDPIENWNKHNAYILEKYTKLNNFGINKLVYKSSNGTDFSIKLLKGVKFQGGAANLINGVVYNPNMPTEECFTSPDPRSASGVVYATKPLSLNGKVIKDFGFRFENGKAVEVLAKDEETKAQLNELISLDEGASRLGEVALVPFDSPVNKTGLLFFNTLFDENACCHLALGMGFEDCIDGFENMSREEIEAVGLNDSIIHIDFMVGSADLSIKAELNDGKIVDIFKDGTWAI